MSRGEQLRFDPKCYELAKYFYPDAQEIDLNALAQRLQDTIEDDVLSLEDSP